jgi:hypothetical protein
VIRALYIYLVCLALTGAWLSAEVVVADQMFSEPEFEMAVR